MIPVLLSFFITWPVQTAVIVSMADEYLTRDNTCYEFQVYYGKKDVTYDSTMVIKERKSIFDAMSAFFPDPCYYSKYNQKQDQIRKLYAVKASFFLADDGQRVKKMQMSVLRIKEGRNLVSLIYIIRADPPRPEYVVLYQEIVKAHIEFLQKLPQSRPCP